MANPMRFQKTIIVFTWIAIAVVAATAEDSISSRESSSPPFYTVTAKQTIKVFDGTVKKETSREGTLHRGHEQMLSNMTWTNGSQEFQFRFLETPEFIASWEKSEPYIRVYKNIVPVVTEQIHMHRQEGIVDPLLYGRGILNGAAIADFEAIFPAEGVSAEQATGSEKITYTLDQGSSVRILTVENLSPSSTRVLSYVWKSDEGDTLREVNLRYDSSELPETVPSSVIDRRFAADGLLRMETIVETLEFSEDPEKAAQQLALADMEAPNATRVIGDFFPDTRYFYDGAILTKDELIAARAE